MGMGIGIRGLTIGGQNGGVNVGQFQVAGNVPDVVVSPSRDFYASGGTGKARSTITAFSRSGTATYTDSGGVIRSAATGVIRDGHHVYLNGRWKRGCLLESAARTNLWSGSADFTTGFSATGLTRTKDVTTGPDGGTTFNTLVEDTSTGFHRVFRAIGAPVSISTTYCHSYFVKAFGRTRITVETGGAGFPVAGGAAAVTFDLSTGTKVSESGNIVLAGIEDWGGGVYRVYLSSTATVADTGLAYVYILGPSDAKSYTGDGTSGIYIWGGQCEVGATPSSYIPTTGGTATRNAETWSLDDEDMGYSSTAMWFAMDGLINYADQNSSSAATFFSWINGSNFLSVFMRTDGTNTGQLQFRKSNTVNVTLSGPSDGLAPGTNVPFSIAFSVSGTAANAGVDGTATSGDTTTLAIPDLSTNNLSLGPTFSGVIFNFRKGNGFLDEQGVAEGARTLPTSSAWIGRKWISYGDSITFQLEWQPIVSRDYGLYHVQRGVGGRLMAGVSGMHTTAALNTLPSNIDLLTILAGVNDWAQSTTIGTSASTNTAEFWGAYKACLDELLIRYPNTQIALVTLPLCNRNSDFAGLGWSNAYTNLVSATTASYSTAIRSIAALYGVGVIDWEDYEADQGITDANLATYRKAEGNLIHPNDAGGVIGAASVALWLDVNPPT